MHRRTKKKEAKRARDEVEGAAWEREEQAAVHERRELLEELIIEAGIDLPAEAEAGLIKRLVPYVIGKGERRIVPGMPLVNWLDTVQCRCHCYQLFMDWKEQRREHRVAAGLGEESEEEDDAFRDDVTIVDTPYCKSVSLRHLREENKSDGERPRVVLDDFDLSDDEEERKSATPTFETILARRLPRMYEASDYGGRASCVSVTQDLASDIAYQWGGHRLAPDETQVLSSPSSPLLLLSVSSASPSLCSNFLSSPPL